MFTSLARIDAQQKAGFDRIGGAVGYAEPIPYAERIASQAFLTICGRRLT
jgi:hypothetical protein